MGADAATLSVRPRSFEVQSTQVDEAALKPRSSLLLIGFARAGFLLARWLLKGVEALAGKS